MDATSHEDSGFGLMVIIMDYVMVLVWPVHAVVFGGGTNLQLTSLNFFM
jgi:hypothetical protein